MDFPLFPETPLYRASHSKSTNIILPPSSAGRGSMLIMDRFILKKAVLSTAG